MSAWRSPLRWRRHGDWATSSGSDGGWSEPRRRPDAVHWSPSPATETAGNEREPVTGSLA